MTDLPEETEADDTEETCEVWRDNIAAVSAFLACRTLWRRLALGMSGVVVWDGIDYAAAAPILARRHRRAARVLLADLRLMEAEALPILNDRGTDGA